MALTISGGASAPVRGLAESKRWPADTACPIRDDVADGRPADDVMTGSAPGTGGSVLIAFVKQALLEKLFLQLFKSHVKVSHTVGRQLVT
jgi:hypothetical protein